MTDKQRKRGIRNVLYGLLNKTLTIILGLLVPKIIILYMGSDINGLISTITQVYGCVTILEAGVGFATTQALYQPVAAEDKNQISRILSATNVYYKKIGTAYLGLILALTFFFPYIGNSPLSDMETRLLVFLTGVAGVITFFFQGKFLLLLEAQGRSYILHNVSSISSLAVHLAKIILIINGYQIIAVQTVIVIIQMSVMLYYEWLKRREYGWLDLSLTPNYIAISKKNNVLFHRICWFVFSNTDIIMISVFLNYTWASIYSIYSLIVTTVYSLIGLIWTSTVFYWGQSYNCGKELFQEENLEFQKLYYAIAFAGNSIMFLMTQPFIRVYISGVRDAEYLNTGLLILFTIVYILQALRIPSISLTEIAGHFKETQIQAIIESFLNLSLSLLFVKIMGIYGILLGTVIAIIYRNISLVEYVSKKIMPGSNKEIYKAWIKNSLLMSVSIVFGYMVKMEGVSWFILIENGVRITIIVCVIFGLGNLNLLKCYVFKGRNCLLHKQKARDDVR